jgi:hypothetical protein
VNNPIILQTLLFFFCKKNQGIFEKTYLVVFHLFILLIILYLMLLAKIYLGKCLLLDCFKIFMYHYLKTYSRFDMINCEKMVSLFSIKAIFFLLCCSFLCILFTGCTAETSNTTLQKKIDSEALRVLKDSNSVTAFTIQAKINGSFQITSEKDLTTDQIASLRKIVLPDPGYIFDMHKRCVFIPDIGFSFDNERVVLLISRSCQQIKFLETGTETILDYNPQKKDIEAFIKKLKFDVSQ